MKTFHNVLWKSVPSHPTTHHLLCLMVNVQLDVRRKMRRAADEDFAVAQVKEQQRKMFYRLDINILIIMHVVCMYYATRKKGHLVVV